MRIDEPTWHCCNDIFQVIFTSRHSISGKVFFLSLNFFPSFRYFCDTKSLFLFRGEWLTTLIGKMTFTELVKRIVSIFYNILLVLEIYFCMSPASDTWTTNSLFDTYAHKIRYTHISYILNFHYLQSIDCNILFDLFFLYLSPYIMFTENSCESCVFMYRVAVNYVSLNWVFFCFKSFSIIPCIQSDVHFPINAV
jgi:hypothetical protein